MCYALLLRPRILAALMLALSAMLLGGCETQVSLGKKIDYHSSISTPTLEIPPDLTTPTYDDRYLSSTASGAAAARAAGKPSDVLPGSTEAHLARAGAERWLVVKTTPDIAWKTLQQFWPANGFVLAVEQPTLGIMETDWAENRASTPKTWLGQYFDTKYFNWLTDTYRRDKFRTRIEKGTEPGTVEIYISHMGAVQTPTKLDSRMSKYGDDWQWTASEPDPELEAEFLSRLMLRFGAPAQAAAAVEAGVPAQPLRARIEKNGDGTTRLVVDDSFDRAWRRVGLALDRTGFTVVDRDRSKGLYFVRYSDPELDPRQKGWLDKLMFWKSDDKEKPEQYRVVVKEIEPSSVVTVEDPQGGEDHSANGQKILALLQDQLK